MGREHVEAEAARLQDPADLAMHVHEVGDVLEHVR